MDLSRATNCIEAMKENGTYRGEKIGIVQKDMDNLAHYKRGQVVIYREEMTPSDGEMSMGEYMGREQKPRGIITVEIPMSSEDITKQRAKHSLLTTFGCTIRVPEKYIEEVVL
jgi:hypothetical protein